MGNEYDLVVMFIKTLIKQKVSGLLTTVKEWLKMFFDKIKVFYFKIIDFLSYLMPVSSTE